MIKGEGASPRHLDGIFETRFFFKYAALFEFILILTRSYCVFHFSKGD